jgi:hypothetical protein
LNAHDTSQGSHYYPIVSARAINPALIGTKLYDLPAPFVEQTTKPVETTTPLQVLSEENKQTTNAQPVSIASTSYISIVSLITCILIVNIIRIH